jgi:hypothetical protein
VALPELLMPSGTPAFLAAGHGIELVPIHADVQFRTGHSRKRRVYTVAPRFVDVGLLLEAPQMAAFHAWFEGPLQVGAQSFTAAVANQGPGLLYWQARFEAPYTAVAEALGRWVVTARLRLVGDGQAGPPVATSMGADTVVALTASSSAVFSLGLGADTVVALQAAQSSLSADTVVALTSTRDGAPPSAVDFEKRWIWTRYPYSFGRTADVTDVSEFDQRSWMGF